MPDYTRDMKDLKNGKKEAVWPDGMTWTIGVDTEHFAGDGEMGATSNSAGKMQLFKDTTDGNSIVCKVVNHVNKGRWLAVDYNGKQFLELRSFREEYWTQAENFMVGISKKLAKSKITKETADKEKADWLAGKKVQAAVKKAAAPKGKAKAKSKPKAKGKAKGKAKASPTSRKRKTVDDDGDDDGDDDDDEGDKEKKKGDADAQDSVEDDEEENEDAEEENGDEAQGDEDDGVASHKKPAAAKKPSSAASSSRQGLEENTVVGQGEEKPDGKGSDSSDGKVPESTDSSQRASGRDKSPPSPRFRPPPMTGFWQDALWG